MSDPTPPLTAPTPRTAPDVVRTFLAALERLDLDAAGELLDPDVVYENVSASRVVGRAATLRLLGSLFRPCSGFEATVHRMAATGPVVLTERTDAIVVGRLRVAFWVCGTFEVHDGRITLWRDYFDYADAVRGVAVGVGRAALSLVRRPSHGPDVSPREGRPAPSGGDAARAT